MQLSEITKMAETVSSGKTCTRCGETKVISEFGISPRYADGFRTWCKECCKEDHKIYYLKNRKKINEKTSKRQKEKPREYWAYSTMCGHRSRGCVVIVTKEELIALAYSSFNCGICGCLLDWSLIGKNGSPCSSSPSLDRINQENTLTMDNIQIICSKCNVTKNDRTMQEFIDYCTMVTLKLADLSKLWG